MMSITQDYQAAERLLRRPARPGVRELMGTQPPASPRLDRIGPELLAEMFA